MKKAAIRQRGAQIIALLLLFTATLWAHVARAEPTYERRASDPPGFVFHYPPPFARAVDKLEARAPETGRRIARALGTERPERVEVWLLPDLDDYFEATGQPGRAPEWAVGLSLSDRRTVLVRHGLGPNRRPVDIEKTFDHELAHVLIDVARRGHPVPRWFNEGFASLAAEEWTLERSEEIARSGATGSLRPFAELERTFPDHAERTSAAYAQAHHFARLMRDRFGEEVFGRIIERLRAGDSFSVAFTIVTGQDFERTEAAWRRDLEERTSPWSGLADGGFLFFGAGLLFLVAWWVRRRRARAKFAHLDDAVDGWDYDRDRYRLPTQRAPGAIAAKDRGPPKDRAPRAVGDDHGRSREHDS